MIRGKFRTGAARSADGSVTISEIERRQRAWADEQPTLTLCGFCGWRHEGSAVDGRVAYGEHRAAAHPESLKGKRGSAKRRKDVEIEEARARLAEREDADRLAKIEQGRRRAELTSEQRTRADALLTWSRSLPERGRPVLEEAVGVGDDPSASEIAATPLAASERFTASSSTAKHTPKRSTAWTREEAIASVRARAAELGRPPSYKDCLGDGRIPQWPTQKRLFGSFGAMVEAAGFPRPTRGTRYSAVSEREPQGDVAAVEPVGSPAPASAHTASAATGELQPSRSETADRVRNHFAAMRAEIDRLERALLDELFGEELAA